MLLKKGLNKMDSWLKNVEYLLKWQSSLKNLDSQKQMTEKIKEINKRALQSLDKRDHVTYLNRYAVSEYRSGHLVEGRTQFENILSTFPKRADIWSFN